MKVSFQPMCVGRWQLCPMHAPAEVCLAERVAVLVLGRHGLLAFCASWCRMWEAQFAWMLGLQECLGLCCVSVCAYTMICVSVMVCVVLMRSCVCEHGTACLRPCGHVHMCL